MRTLILDPAPAKLAELLEERRHAGLDRLDEVWDGVLHMTPGPAHAHADVAQQLAELLGPPARAAGLFPTMGEFNVGLSEHDYRVPDGGLHRTRENVTWHATVALVVEIVSPGDESWEKLPFYAQRNVDELLIVDPQRRSVDWLALNAGEYEPISRSSLIELGTSELTQRIDWPPLTTS